MVISNEKRDGHVGGISRLVLSLASRPGPEIHRVAQGQGCDLIVMRMHGPNDANRLFAGSVAQYVLANSSIPVLLLRDPREAQPPDFTEDAPA